jgi:hypothetical protein
VKLHPWANGVDVEHVDDDLEPALWRKPHWLPS